MQLTTNPNQIAKPLSHLDKVKGMLSSFSRDSVMESNFITQATAKEASDRDYDNFQSLMGKYLREAVVEPIRQYASSIDKGVTGKPLTIQDLVNITQGNMEFAGTGATAGIAKAGGKVSENVVTQFPAFHGSPHKFTEFADKAIGSGEGAQLFGHGHYITDSPGVAKWYADTLGKQTVDWVGGDLQKIAIDDPNTFTAVSGVLQEMKIGAGPEFALERTKNFFDKQISKFSSEGKFDERDAVLNARMAASKLKPQDFEVTRGGYTYKLTAMKGKDPKDYQFLNWDKNLDDISTTSKLFEKLDKSGIADEVTNQTKAYYNGLELNPDEVNMMPIHKRKALNTLHDQIEINPDRTPNELLKGTKYHLQNELEAFLNNADLVKTEPGKASTALLEKANTDAIAFLDDAVNTDKLYVDKKQVPLSSLKGEDLYNELVKLEGSPDKASKRLQEAGVSGIEYPQGSIRGLSRPGRRNYVVFNPKDISVDKVTNTAYKE